MLCAKASLARAPVLPVAVRGLSQSSFHSSAVQGKDKVVILGSGWGGYEVLKGIDKSRYDVTMVSPNTYFNFTPLLASCAVGSLEYRCALEPVRRYTPQVKSYQAWCDAIDFKSKALTCMPATPALPGEQSTAPRADATTTAYPGTGTPFSIPYDKLVISVGAYSQTFGIPGVKEHGYFLKDIKDARSIRTRILECFEQANEPLLSDEARRDILHFCIVGGGPTGIEFGAELHDLLNADIKKHYPHLAPLARISLYDVAPKILSIVMRRYAVKAFKREGIDIFTSHHVEGVEAGRIFVKEQGEVPFGLLVWSTGLSPNPLIETITEAVKHPKTGSVITDDHCQLLMKPSKEGDAPVPNPDVWAVGDAAMIQGIMLPATAQGIVCTKVANQKGKYVAKNLNRMLESQDVSRPFKWKNMGTLAYVGEDHALYDRTKAAKGPKPKKAGRLAWLLWRSAYVSMALSTRNKILIPTFW
ncbi:FAD/NAD P-binding domain-containing protein [Gloeophyllum trabeum ATCC 11539]|uniref:FAD/NAD P-binding domain-containing protein n=1 Tax=Gloeophyllum trabeum (strain ATCC 11539 / FP-39264 / Madison 617) TaxID=670483 RepID=S7Q035_GLOTA|nr:FAD/NAD P-binding domain-containing protein [Gloeophyllum trabeum ATCC 11539]EPQ53048.1 FAD/NAD P-binding domain-containing protein [Gloeophyllum trabeum ATCC 11539]